MSSLITIGRIIKPHGLTGELTVRPLTYSVERFNLLKKIYILKHNIPVEIHIEYFTPHGKNIIIKFTEFNDRDAVNTLKGLDLLIPAEESPPLEEGEYYFYQIIGLEVFTTDGSLIGRVTDIIETGSNDVYVVKKAGQKTGGSPSDRDISEYLIPAIEEVIREIDLKKNRIIIEPVEGLLE
ncbi:ribosome maturation factor RimM [bacterium BMS3Bbin06]|nr:ribosome maturation factor RimM [bacterium BMS3Abin08]GBE34996.1 ribosome maturation factor RimM [bacterium BMS3Bbin06]HDO36818.1 16S rRNA processing protein RimM [Nitrospirota bacterium]HDY71130.1 16S rRNA processing protein RimM [Nitrospirota bacterium]